MKHIMLDLETLGTVASAVIMSIGACRFDLATGAVDDSGFYASISIESNLDYGRRIAGANSAPSWRHAGAKGFGS